MKIPEIFVIGKCYYEPKENTVFMVTDRRDEDNLPFVNLVITTGYDIYWQGRLKVPDFKVDKEKLEKIPLFELEDGDELKKIITTILIREPKAKLNPEYKWLILK